MHRARTLEENECQYLDYAKHNHYDVIVLGALSEAILQQAVHSSIPSTISRKSEQNLILVRAASTVTNDKDYL